MTSGLQSAVPARIIYFLLAVACIGNGLWMLVDPAGWNELLRMHAEDFGGDAVPLHLLRKMGATYLCVSLPLLWCLVNPGVRSRVHPVLALYFALIAGVHAGDILATGAPSHRWITDFPLVFLPPLVLLLMMVPLPARRAAESGRVKWFDARKGFGFIVRADGSEVFVHHRALRGGRPLRDGQAVRFRVVPGPRGLQAEDVSVG